MKRMIHGKDWLLPISEVRDGDTIVVDLPEPKEGIRYLVVAVGENGAISRMAHGMVQSGDYGREVYRHSPPEATYVDEVPPTPDVRTRKVGDELAADPA